MTKLIVLLLIVLGSAILVVASNRPPITSSKAQLGGGWYNITITDASSSPYKRLVKIISTDQNGNVLFQQSYNDAIEYYDGHKTSLITREGFSFKYEYAFGCYRRCISTALIRNQTPLLVTYEYPGCGGDTSC